MMVHGRFQAAVGRFGDVQDEAELGASVEGALPVAGNILRVSQAGDQKKNSQQHPSLHNVVTP